MYLYCTTCKAFCVFVRGYLCVYVCILSWVVSGWASNVPSFTELILLISLPYFNIFFHFLFGFDFFFFFKWEKSHKIQEAADSQFAFWPQTCLPLPFSSFSVQLSPFYIFNLLILILEFFSTYLKILSTLCEIVTSVVGGWGQNKPKFLCLLIGQIHLPPLWNHFLFEWPRKPFSFI